MQRTAVVARQLNEIAPGTVRVRIVPVQMDDRRRVWIALNSATGPVVADREQHRAALGLLRRMLPAADWTRAATYDASTGELTPDALCASAELGLDTAEVA
jgi:hypothetical protein